MEATGVYWHTPWQALTDAGIEAQLLHAQHVRQLRGRKTDVEDSRWLARVCQFGLGRPSFVPSQQFRDLRSLSRHRRKLVARRSQVRNQAQKAIDRGGVRIGAVLTDIFGKNGRRILDGLVDRLNSTDILASLSSHVRLKLARLGDALSLELRDTERLLLADLLAEHDALTRRVLGRGEPDLHHVPVGLPVRAVARHAERLLRDRVLLGDVVGDRTQIVQQVLEGLLVRLLGGGEVREIALQIRPQIGRIEVRLILDVRNCQLTNLNESVGGSPLARVQTTRTPARARIVREGAEIRHTHLRQGELESGIDDRRPGDAADDGEAVVLLDEREVRVDDEPEGAVGTLCRHGAIL